MRAEETEGRLFCELGRGEWNDPKLRSLLEAVLPNERAFHDFEVDKEFPDLGRKTLLLNATRIAWEGSNDMILVAMEDITERKRAEEQSRLLFEEQEARKHAETANRIKDEFLSVVSHELRTPLHVISGWVEVLRSGHGEKDEAIRAQGLETIERNVRTQTALIEDLLDVSRITSGNIRLEMQVIELGDIFKDALETLRHSAENKLIRIDYEYDGSVGRILGDPNRLRQIIVNLLTNAVKFTPKNGEIKVAVRQEDGRDLITVSDTGIGINPGFLPHVFEPFRLADASSTRRQGGLGLGLSIVKQLVELHGGEVRAESPGEGKGSTFTVALPLTAALQQPMKTHRERVTGNLRAGEQNLCGVRVLVVDDEADTRTIVDLLLRNAGAEVTTVASAAEALSKIKQGKPDILVADLAMPEEDGYALFRKVRALEPEQGGGIPAIALTAYAGREDAEKAIEAGFQRHMAKPVVPSDLIAGIGSLTGRIGK